MPEDCDHRMEYGKLMLGRHENWIVLLEKILWSGEAVFHVGGFINSYNCHYWASDKADPKMMIEGMQARPKVTVRCVMTATEIIDPYFVCNIVNTERYLQMIHNYVRPAVRDWESIDDLIFVQDGAPPHF